MTATGIIKEIYTEKHISEKFNTRELVITTEAETPYPQHVTFQFTNKNCDLLDYYRIGDNVEVTFTLKGRAWNGPQCVKFFNTLDAYHITKVDSI